MGALLIALSIVTVPLLYQIGVEIHAFSLRFIPSENREIQSLSAFMKTNQALLSYEIRAPGSDTKFHKILYLLYLKAV